jgi:hypothetical protein
VVSLQQKFYIGDAQILSMLVMFFQTDRSVDKPAAGSASLQPGFKD